MICGMQEHALQLELPKQDQHSIWPWIVGAIAAVLLLINVVQLTEKIPQSLYNNAQTVISEAGINGALVSVDGRDLILSGTVSQTLDRDAFAQTLADIDGVRIVEDNMSSFDPEEAQRQAQQDFLSALAAVDTSQVAFEPGSVSLTASSKTSLAQLVQLLRAYPQFKIRIAGHTDNTGRPEVNLRISKQRAQAVANYLLQRRVGRDQVIAQGYGAIRPIANNEDKAGRARNRRIEINLID